jgi:hypothetical protein
MKMPRKNGRQVQVRGALSLLVVLALVVPASLGRTLWRGELPNRSGICHTYNKLWLWLRQGDKSKRVGSDKSGLVAYAYYLNKMIMVLF